MAKKILLADDDKQLRELYLDILKSADYEIDTARDGKEALERISNGGYDLIIMDVIMPQIDGIGVLKQLKDNPPKVKNGPILMFTNLADDPAVEEAPKIGAAKVLIKTKFNPEQFLKVVKGLLD